jgi:hypothetical protein
MTNRFLEPIQDKEKLEKVGDLYQEIYHTNNDYFHLWKSETLFHWDFWVSLSFAIIPWLIWWRFHKKDSGARLLLVGFVIMVVTSWLDFIGVIYGLWYYTGKVFPSLPSYIPWDFCIFPVFIMLTLQYKPQVKPWKKALFFSSVSTFIGEPIFWWLGFYVLTKWNMLYSFPIYYLIYLLADKVSRSKNFNPL